MADRREYERVAQEALPILYKIAMGILRCDADARDAVQQALLKGWEKKENAQEGKFHWYLTRIVINECRNIQRQRMRVFPAEMPPAVQKMEPDYRDLYDAIFQLRIYAFTNTLKCHNEVWDATFKQRSTCPCCFVLACLRNQFSYSLNIPDFCPHFFNGIGKSQPRRVFTAARAEEC